MDWAQGYPADERYLDTVQTHLAPATLDLALLVAGRRPPRKNARFRYAELGCGSAFTLIGLAALYPEASFLGVDFMPEHVVRARDLISEAGLENIEIRAANFADLATVEPPETVDYVAIHGVWTWVSPTNRAHLAGILGRWLAPGGVAVIGYNCAAGWADAAPIREIFRRAPPGSRDAPFAPARAAVDAWIALGASDQAKAFWTRLSKYPDSFLAHELGAHHGEAIWLSDLEAELAPQKLSFLVSAHLHEQFDALRFAGTAAEFVKGAAEDGWGETARDIAARRSFRADIFGNGVPRLPIRDATRRLRDLRIAHWPARLAEERQFADGFETRPLAPRVADAVFAALDGEPATLGEFTDGIDLPEYQAFQAALVSLARGDVRTLADTATEQAAADPVARLVAALRDRYLSDTPIKGVPSPRRGEMVLLGADEANDLFAADGPADPKDGFARLGLA